MSLVRELGRGLLDLIYPSQLKCYYCGNKKAFSTKIHLCEDCLSRIEYITTNYCQRCGKLLTSPGLCYSCQQEDHYFLQARAATFYNEAMKEYIYQLKYQQSQQLAQPLGRILGICGINFYGYQRFDVVVPVPLAAEKLMKRGFNQAALLADSAAKEMKLKVNNQLLKRTINSKQQSKLSAIARRENVKNIFYAPQEVVDQIKGQRILLVDDIYTTGATVNECSRVLLAAGVDSVTVLTLATGRQM
ncbi:MAG: ComF family protein [Bacillota bacterium]